ncbi:MAG TPA: protein kinase, partial [Planctomycetota bacterium]|nr:protein kinase [Planctomycetota bacterium]
MNLDRLRDFMNDPGRRIGKYEIVRPIGEGGMGVVYEAFDPDLKRTVALKVLKQADADRLRREASAAAKLRHPNIVTIYEIGPDFIAMEYVRKGSCRNDRQLLRQV